MITIFSVSSYFLSMIWCRCCQTPVHQPPWVIVHRHQNDKVEILIKIENTYFCCMIALRAPDLYILTKNVWKVSRDIKGKLFLKIKSGFSKGILVSTCNCLVLWSALSRRGLESWLLLSLPLRSLCKHKMSLGVRSDSTSNHLNFPIKTWLHWRNAF